MERIPVSSSSIASIGYDPEIPALEVEYRQGGIYRYQGVSQGVFEQLMNAPSKGTFINQQIKKFYAFVHVG